MIDLLVKNARYLITMDEQRRIFQHGALAVDGDRILAVGGTVEIEKRFPAAHETLDAEGGVVTPGFVNTHIHTTTHFGRGLGDNLSLPVLLHERLFPLEASLSEEETYVAAACSLLETVRYGTTCVCDPGAQKPEAVVRAVRDIGLRAVLTRSLTDMGGGRSLPGSFDSTTEDAVSSGEAFVKEFHGSDHGRIRAWFSLRTERMVSDELCRTIAELARKYKVGISSHMCATEDSIEQHKKIFSGQRPIERYASNGLLGPNLLLIHCHWLEPDEWDLMAAHGVKVIDCPTTSIVLGYGGLPRATHMELLKRGVCVALGTDHSACSNTHDLLRVAQYFRAYQDILKDPGAVTAELILELLTINGARSLLWENEIGSLEVGKRADLIVFDTKRPEWIPLHNPVSNIGHAVSGDSVKTVIVDGRVILRNGIFVSIDAEALLQRGQELAERVASRLGLDRYARPAWPVV